MVAVGGEQVHLARLRQQLHLVGRSARPGPRSGRAARERAAEGLGPAPAGDPPVVARAQDLGDGPAPELGRPGVLRVLEQARR